MPILKNGNIICHFAHIPKCGGTSVEVYARRIGLQVAFLDRQYSSNPSSQKWNCSSPQHIDGISLTRLFPPKFFNFGFAVIRSPIDRMVSAFKHQMIIEKTIDRNIDINFFVDNDLEYASKALGKYDNHFWPQTAFFIPGKRYKIFSFENGFRPVKKFIDSAFFGSDQAVQIPHEHKIKEFEMLDSEIFKLSQKSISRLIDIYQVDFKTLPLSKTNILCKGS